MPEEDAGLVGHWPLGEDTNDHSPFGHVTEAVDVRPGASGPCGGPGTASSFNGETSVLEVSSSPALRFGTGDFTVALWIRTDERKGDVVGDLVSTFDTERRNGINLSILTCTGVTSTAQACRRHLHFGIDNGREDPSWQDCGRPGNAVFVGALALVDGLLYAGTLETGPDEMGHLWRYDGGQKWVDLDNPVGCNSIHCVAEFDRSIYVGTGRHNCQGSVLGETLNTIPGGKIYRLAEDETWGACGHPGHEDATPEEASASGFSTGKADEAKALTVFEGNLYCVSNHRRGVFRYGGGADWSCVGLDQRIMTLTVSTAVASMP